jgi:hypothetical protein
MASRAAQTRENPVQIKLKDGSDFVCPCGRRDFRVTEEPIHWICQCGRIYVEKDF